MKNNLLGESGPIPMAKFSKDHWSVLGYVDSCCSQASNTTCTLDKGRLRCNANRHPAHANDLFIEWHSCFGTHLSDFYELPNQDNPIPAILSGVLLPDHDDIDCLHDLQAAGLVKILAEGTTRVRLTREGARVANLIRSHKGNGGLYSSFKLVYMAVGREDNAAEPVAPRPRRKAESIVRASRRKHVEAA